jgi:putative ABC transport system permease protein
MLKNYLKIALKVLLRRKFFTFISLFGIGFTLIVLMVAVAFLDHVFGPNAVESRNDRTLGIFHLNMKTPDGHGHWGGPAGYLFLDRYTRDLPDVENMSLFTEARQAISYHNGQKIQSYLKRTDGEFWQILNFRFLEGGPFLPEDETNRNLVAVINRETRQKFFGDQPALGRSIEIDGQTFRISGVVENVPFLRQIPFADIWAPISTIKNDSYRKELMGEFHAIYLARSAADFPTIQEEFRARLAKVEFPDPKKWSSISGHMDTYFEATARELFGQRDDESDSNPSGRLLAAIVIIAVLFMLLPTINLININVSRIMERASEIGVRKAFGASSLDLVGQFIVENISLTLLGGAIGFVLSRFVLRSISESGWFPYAEFTLNYRIFLGGILTAMIFGLFSGVYPAWRMSRLHPVEAIKGGLR